jgi:hypothetical protein
MVDVKGRGAFTSVGKDNGKSWYAFVKGSPLDGSSPEKSFNHEAVTLGVMSIEQRLNDLGYDLVVDGTYGPKVKKAIKDFQKKNGVSVTGEIGYTTGPLLWHDHIASVGVSYKFPTELIWGIMKQESGGDPGAVGYDTPGDRGLFQFNTLVHAVTYEQAHDFEWATETMFTRFSRAWKDYAGKGEELRINCSIMQHKSPVAADYWFATGEPSGPISVDYVSKVKGFAKTF